MDLSQWRQEDATLPVVTGKIPRDPSWCSHCRAPETYGDGSPCSAHRDPDGAPRAYDGPEVYEATEWVLRVVGKHYRTAGPQGIEVLLCDGYDPRHGFWMRDPDSGAARNVRERAIGTTFHESPEFPGWLKIDVLNWVLAEQEAGRQPTSVEVGAEFKLSPERAERLRLALDAAGEF